ncbi:MAG: hypothetical protein WCH98_16370 [Verrucomicrobiota bacterium]
MKHKILSILFLGLTAATLTSCSQADVAARQQAISSAQGNVLSNRATRLQARDERMWAARDVWMQ